MHRAEFGGNRLGCGANRFPIPQVHHGGKDAVGGEIQVTGQGIQFRLIVIEQHQGMTAGCKGVSRFCSKRTRGAGDDELHRHYSLMASIWSSLMPSTIGRSDCSGRCSLPWKSIRCPDLAALVSR